MCVFIFLWILAIHFSGRTKRQVQEGLMRDKKFSWRLREVVCEGRVGWGDGEEVSLGGGWRGTEMTWETQHYYETWKEPIPDLINYDSRGVMTACSRVGEKWQKVVRRVSEKWKEYNKIQQCSSWTPACWRYSHPARNNGKVCVWSSYSAPFSSPALITDAVPLRAAAPR